jgi:hypothetical protein
VAAAGSPRDALASSSPSLLQRRIVRTSSPSRLPAASSKERSSVSLSPPAWTPRTGSRMPEVASAMSFSSWCCIVPKRKMVIATVTLTTARNVQAAKSR